MKVLKICISVVILFLSLSSEAVSQNLDSLGLDDNSILNSSESQFLYSKFRQQVKRNQFDFTNKQAGFVLWHSQKQHWLRPKSEYFKGVKESLLGDYKRHDSLLIFTENEKNRSGGYDAVIISWVKGGAIDKKARKELINNLRKGK